METNGGDARTTSRDVAIPAAGLSALRRQFQKESDSLAAIHALQAAGFTAGEAMWDGMRRGPGRDLAGLDEGAFWDRLAAVLRRRGWGTLTHRDVHPGVGLLDSADWAEAGNDSDEAQPSCSFSAGMLSGLLSGVAEGPVAVLEVSCRAQGDDRCTFAFGSAATVHDLYGLLVDGRPLDAALHSL